MIARFLARWSSGVLDRHELPQPVAAEFAEQLRVIVAAITWAPLVAPPGPTGPTRRERKAGARQQQRQLAEMEVVR
jgi:hypothetical protein